MSVFTSRVTDTVTIPDEGSVTIRKLAPRHLEAARKEQTRKSLKEMKEIGPAFWKELQSLNDKEKEAERQKAREADPLSDFDRHTLLVSGIVAWTFDEPLPEEKDARAGAIDDLEDDVQETVAKAILKLAKPSLFVDAEVAQKNA